MQHPQAVRAMQQEAESTRPGYREILTTHYEVTMSGEVFSVDTPHWIPITNE